MRLPETTIYPPSIQATAAPTTIPADVALAPKSRGARPGASRPVRLRYALSPGCYHSPGPSRLLACWTRCRITEPARTGSLVEAAASAHDEHARGALNAVRDRFCHLPSSAPASALATFRLLRSSAMQSSADDRIRPRSSMLHVGRGVAAVEPRQGTPFLSNPLPRQPPVGSRVRSLPRTITRPADSMYFENRAPRPRVPGARQGDYEAAGRRPLAPNRNRCLTEPGSRCRLPANVTAIVQRWRMRRPGRWAVIVHLPFLTRANTTRWPEPLNVALTWRPSASSFIAPLTTMIPVRHWESRSRGRRGAVTWLRTLPSSDLYSVWQPRLLGFASSDPSVKPLAVRFVVNMAAGP